jgi:hypothetical protein
MQPHHNSNVIIHVNGKIDPKIHMEAKNTSNPQSNPQQ